jgi:predicted  nucleic acid-binding Zn-ribbon protein
VRDELSSLQQENEELIDLLDNRDHMLREAKKLKMEHRALLEDSRTTVAELETQVLDGKHEIDSLKASPMISEEIDCADLTALRKKHASKCEELDVLTVELGEQQSRPVLLGAYTSCLVLHEKIVELQPRIVSLEADLKVHIPTSCSTCELHAINNLDCKMCWSLAR